VVPALADLMDADDRVRAELADLLRGGRVVESEDRPMTSEASHAIVAQLASIPRDDRRTKLVIAGFLDHPYAPRDEDVVEACQTCMYFEVHRRFCNLPELMLPVEPQWSCRLWRI
jgi:hypothetical protein